MNYKIVMDEEKLKSFIDWLPHLKLTEQFYYCLFARSKYTKNEAGENGIPHIKSDKAQLKRGVSTKERLFQKIKQLEIEIGNYYQKDTAIPQEALALYITPNPREMWKATFNSLIKLSQCIRDTNILVNPQAEVMSEIQRTKGTTHFVDFDIDEKEYGVEGTILYTINGIKNSDIVNWNAVTVLRTRGGAHLLVEVKKVEQKYKSSFYKKLSSWAGVDQTGDQMIPVPGCYQGGFVPYFL